MYIHSKETNKFDVYQRYNHIGLQTKFTWTPAQFTLHVTQCSLYFGKQQIMKINSLILSLPIIFCPEISGFVLRLLYIFKYIYSNAIQTTSSHESKHYEPWSDCSMGSCLIWVHIVCNIGFLSVNTDKWADDNCHEQRYLGSLYCKQYGPWSEIRLLPWNSLIGVHPVCFHGESILKCIWVYAADWISKSHLLDNKYWQKS